MKRFVKTHPRRLALVVGVCSLAVVFGLINLVGCRTPEAIPDDSPEIYYLIIGGQKIPTTARVINFEDPGGYNAYTEHCWFEPDRVNPTKPLRGTDQPIRWRKRSLEGLAPATAARVEAAGWDLPAVQEKVDQFVMHYDVCGCSRSCFKVLHDLRGLSVHFMLDLDGTIYQTMDLCHRALHATIANDRSIGIEIAQMGAYEKRDALRQWYREDETGRVRIHLSPHQGDGGFRTPDFIARPSSDTPVYGPIHETHYWQYQFTSEQYESLVALSRTLVDVLPALAPVAPMDANGKPLARQLTKTEFRDFKGFLGHFHVQRNKRDPGPAFDWARLIEDIRADAPASTR